MNTLIVSSTADSGQGSLREAIARAKNGDSITFSSKLQKKTIKLTSGQLVVDKDLTIDGSAATGVVISGNNSSRVFYLEKKKRAVLKNITVANGKTSGAGGGIDTRHESVITLDNVSVRNNASELGGGMRVGHLAKATILNSSFKENDGTLTTKYKGFSSGAIVHNESRGQLIIKNTTFDNNKGFIGGAIYSFSSVSFTVENSTFRNNSSVRSGGAIFTDGVSSRDYNSGLADDGKLIIRGSRFEGNKTEGEGGALYLWGYTQKQRYKDDRAAIENSVFVDNIAAPDAKGKAKGGAIWAKMGLDIRNVTFANNTATQQGGALWTESSLPINIVNSTFSGNRVLQDAGGAMFLNNRSTPVNITNSTIVYNQAGRANGALWFDGSHNVTLKNSIVAFNTTKRDYRQSQVGYHANNGGGNLEFGPPGALRVIKSGSTVADPQIGALTLVGKILVHPLKAGSPAIDAGVTQGAPKIDQRGTQRDSRVDIGSFELRSGLGSVVEASLVATPSFSHTGSPESVAYLKLDEARGRQAEDQSTADRRNTGALVGDASWTKGVKQGAIAFNGKGDAIEFKNSSDINLGTHGQRTVSLDFKVNDINSDKRQVIYEEGANTRGLNIYLDGNMLYVGGWNTPGKESGWSGTWLSTELSTSQIASDEWHHVDLVLNGGRQITQDALRGYLDGQQFGSGVGSQLWSHGGGVSLGSISGGTRFHDGLTPNSGSSFAGKIDEVMIFNDALSSQKIEAFV